MTAVVIERTGAQVLPPASDERGTVTAYSAYLACDADLRTRSQAYRVLASQLLVVTR